MKVSLIITTYNRPDALQLVIQSAMKQSVIPTEIIIGDDGSEDSTQSMIDTIKQSTTIPLIHVWQKDLGFRASRIRNLAIKSAKYDYLIIIDGDMVLHHDFIKSHTRLAKKNAFLQGHRVLLNDLLTNRILSNEKVKLGYFTKGLSNKKNSLYIPIFARLLLREDKRLRTFKGCNFSCWKEDLLTINGFNDDFVGWGKEDTEFAVRMMNSGVKKLDIRFNAIAYHLDHKENSKNTETAAYLKNLIRLSNTQKQKLLSCKNGINQIL